jgi:hypothetical protein
MAIENPGPVLTTEQLDAVEAWGDAEPQYGIGIR